MTITSSARLRTGLAITAAVVGITATGVAVADATPSSGLLSVIISRGVVAEEVKITTKAIKLKTKGSFEIINQNATFQPGGTSGWHTHPGPVFVTVKTGAVTVYDATCVPRVYTAGQGFMEGPEASVVRNEGGVVSENLATLLVPAGNAPRSESASLCPGIA